jgi:hypothetical protein
MVTRTFTEAEEEVLTRMLLACRPAVSEEDRKIIDGIIRDGWVRIGKGASAAPSVHKATPEPNPAFGVSTCIHCYTDIKRVPGGRGPTWVHTETGAVAGSGPSVNNVDDFLDGLIAGGSTNIVDDR